jgi:two-component system sensor histidine kinase KdpD
MVDRERVFEPFQRLGDRSGDAGAGLGLAIAKGFVEVIGARLELDDTPGGGSTFTIILPIADHIADHAADHIADDIADHSQEPT